MHCKGVEFPAYLPQTNPGYPWALAGGHMSMNTYLLLLYKKETGMDYWVDAIAKWGWLAIRDDLSRYLSNLRIADVMGETNRRKHVHRPDKFR